MSRKYKAKFLHEAERFNRCNRQAGSPEPTDVGLEQFFDYESKGIKPDNPDRYFTHLCDGKAWWEWTLNFYADRFCKGDWDGWDMLAQDFWNDPAGFRQLRQRIGFSPVEPERILCENMLPGEVFLGLGI